MSELKTKEKILQEIKTANKNILKTIIKEDTHIVGNSEEGIVFRVDFSNSEITNSNIVSFKIENLKKAIEIIKEIDNSDSDLDMNLNSIYRNSKVDDRKPLFLVCHFRKHKTY